MLGTCFLLNLVVAIRAEMEGFIVGGSYARITKYPHSAFLSLNCVFENVLTEWICGSSVLNEQLLLTAGHCLQGCSTGTKIIVHLGDANRQSGTIRSSSGFLVHEKYEGDTFSYDIALVKLYKPLKFNPRINRVTIMRRPPYNEIAHVAGWGLTNEKNLTFEAYLKHTDQRVWKHAECIKQFSEMPKGSICASSRTRNNFAAQGDSGSALVVRGYIQIGLLSYKVPDLADNVLVYTDVGYHYDWIIYNSKRLYYWPSL